MKKSTMVSAAEKYASEIEIFTFGRGFGAQISRSTVQKRRFNQSMNRLFGRTDFFNRIGQKQTFAISFMGPSIVIVVSYHAQLLRFWFFQHRIQFHHFEEASAEFNGQRHAAGFSFVSSISGTSAYRLAGRGARSERSGSE
ncbi:hypothetical protein SB759_24780 [Pseudomonas sp. SIMBA_059]